MKTLFSQTLELISSSDELLVHEIPNHLLDAWIIGIADRPEIEYNFERDFIVNIFNEIYEGYKESQGINPAEDDHDREQCRQSLESILRAEQRRRLVGDVSIYSIYLFDMFSLMQNTAEVYSYFCSTTYELK